MARGSDCDEEVGIGDAFHDQIHLVGYFAEPDDIGACAGLIAGGAGQSGVHLQRGGPSGVAGRAEGAIEDAVHMDDLLRACGLVQPVYVLGDEREVALHQVFELCEGDMGGIGLGDAGLRAAGIVEGVDEVWISGEALGGCDVFDGVGFPQSACIAEGAEAAFGGDACAGEDDDLVHKRYSAKRRT